ncbi:MAG TPA: hypothetical protein VFA70_02020, partial [Dehalococcoidia bacterium]|nr:hypothetical protein [Dehalococcoidia bacterium]
NPPGGGDTDQRLNASGKDYFADLWALACDRVAETSDHGATAKQNAYGCNSPTVKPSSRPDGSDRQWLSVFDPRLTGVTSTAIDAGKTPITYMEYNNLQTTQTGCSYWVKSYNGTKYTPANNDNGNFGCDGYPSVDQLTGKVFEASGCGTTGPGDYVLCLNIGTPVDSAGDLCFLDDNGSETIGGASVTCPKGSGLITVASGIAGDPDLLFAVSSMDTGRNLHITYAVSAGNNWGAYQVFTTVAPANNPTTYNGCKTNCWNHWATPVQVSQSPSVNVFPWVVAGGPGRSDSVWYGTNSVVDPSSNSGQAWNVYMNQVVWHTNGKAVDPTQAPLSTNLVRVSPHPNHYDSICLAGTGCITQQGDRNLADFFTVTIDHSGAAEVEYDDTSNGLEQVGFTPGNGLFDHAGAPVVTIARQDGGPGLFGSDVTLRPNEPSSAPTTGQYDASGDALYPVIGGTNVPAFDFTNSKTLQNDANQLSLNASHTTLTVQMHLADLSATGLLSAVQKVPGAKLLQYVTRWILCAPYAGPGTSGNCKIYYAEAEVQVIGGTVGFFQFYAGQAASIDLCSVSACDPHVETYPDAPSFNSGGTQVGGFTVSGTANQSTGLITIQVPVNDIGSPNGKSLLEEVGSYAFGSARGQSLITNADAEADLLPLEIDGVCCFNFGPSQPTSNVPEAPFTPGLLVVGVALIGAGVVTERRRRRAGTAPRS